MHPLEIKPNHPGLGGRKLMKTNEFSVVQFFKDDTYEKVREFVEAAEAVEAFKHYTTNVASKIGITKRVIITDGGDCVNMEWVAGKGITFPTDVPDNIKKFYEEGQ